ncbi:MAG: hypothetical protein RL329_2492 [Bacteroidota bacterium]|jgi:hypothetical protein
MNYIYLKIRLPPFLFEWTTETYRKRFLAITHRYGLSLGMFVVWYAAVMTGTVTGMRTGNDTSTVLLPTSEFAANRPPGTISTIILNDNIHMLLCPKCYGMERLVFVPPKPIPLKINKLKTKSRRRNGNAKGKLKQTPRKLPIVTITI